MRRMLSSALLTALVAGTIVVVAASTAAAVPGDLDPSYGDDGSVVAPHSAHPMFAMVDELGRMVVLALNLDQDIDARMTVIRFTASGEVDSSFSDDGVVLLPASFDGYKLDATTDGLVVGGAFGYDAPSDTAPIVAGLVRLDDDGSFVEDFGDAGVLRLESDPSTDGAFYDVAIDPAGQVVGVGFDLEAPGRPVAVRRYRADGTPDHSFGGDGVVTIQGATGGPSLEADGLGRVVVSFDEPGSTPQQRKPRLVRLDRRGALDPTFASPALAPGFVLGMRRSPTDDSLVLWGSRADGPGRAVWKVNANGTVDQGFEGALASLPSDSAWGAVPLPDGRVAVLQGTGHPDLHPRTALTVLRPDGTLDAAFGTGGTATFEDVSLGIEGFGVGTDGRLLVAGGLDPAEGLGNDFPLEVRAYSTSGLDPVGPVVTSVGARRQALSVAWSAPPPDGPPVVAYEVIGRREGADVARTFVGGDARQATLTGLVNGRAYDVRVVAHTTGGPLAPSVPEPGTPSAAAVVATAASPVEGLAVAAGKGFATATWTPPADDGGSAVVAYSVVTLDKATGKLASWRNVGPTTRVASISGLTNGRQYEVLVVAVTSTGFGAIAPAVTVQPTAASPAPAAPDVAWRAAVPVGPHVVASWGSPVERGQAVTGFNVITIEGGTMTAWQVVGPDQRSAYVSPKAATGPVEVYVVAQSASGLGPIGDPIQLSRAPQPPLPTIA